MSCRVVSLCCWRAVEVHLPDRTVPSSCACSCSGRSDGHTAPRSHTRRSASSPARSDSPCSRCHIWVQSSPRSRGIFPSQDHTERRPRSRTPWNSPDRSCPVHTLCGSGLRGILEDRRTGPTQGDRRLRSYSHTAADTVGRGDQEDRRVHTDVRSSPDRTDTSPSLCHRCRYFDSYISAGSLHQICPQDILWCSEHLSSPDHRYSFQLQSRTLLHYCSYSAECSPPQTSLKGSLVHSPLLFVQGCTRTAR